MATRHNDSSKTRERILKHATVEFSKFGLEGARVDRIARRCRLSKNMLYYYFHSKEGLYLATLENMYLDLRSQQPDLSLLAHDPIAAMEGLIQNTFNAFLRNPGVMRLLSEENAHQGKYIRRSTRIRDLYNPLRESIRQVLERGRAEGTFRTDLDADTIYMSLSSMCYHYLSNRYTLENALGRDLASEEALKQWLDHVTNFILLFCSSDPSALLASRLGSEKVKQAG